MSLLRRHRMARGLTQTALARRLKVVPSTVSLWESGQSVPKASLVPQLARILGINALMLTEILQPTPRERVA